MNDRCPQHGTLGRCPCGFVPDQAMTSPTGPAPMTVLREAVARAICLANGHDPDDTKGVACVRPPMWTVYGVDADAAIATVFAALREPTEEMLRAGAAAVRDFYSEAGPYPRTKAMLRAMLAEAERAAADGKGE